MIDLQSLNFAANDYCELIKQDGSISVYRADIPKLGAIVIKQYELTSTLEKLSFRRKQKNIAHLYAQHFPFLAKLYHIGLTPDKKLGHVVYRHVEGVDFRKIEWLSLSANSVRVIAQEVAQYLHAIHDSGWIHGDFKFGNVMLDLSDESNNNVVHLKNPEVESPDENFDTKIHIVDIEAAVKPRFSVANKKSRDIARFLINAEELGVRQLGIDFWCEYQKKESSENTNKKKKLKKLTQAWCDELSQRHEKKYGRLVKVDFL
ncbi:MAG: hypothetical protein K6L75_13120 [Cellvibrionaceae bacterium]